MHATATAATAAAKRVRQTPPAWHIDVKVCALCRRAVCS